MSCEATLNFTASKAAPRLPCSLCPASGACLAGGLPQAERARWEAMLHPMVPLAHAGKMLFATGDAAEAVFVVRAGTIKTSTVDAEGNERIQGFFFPGDIVGLDAIGSDAYQSTAAAIEPSQVCRVSKVQIELMLSESPVLARRLMERISAGLREALLLSGDYTADERVAAFLLRMQQRAGNPQQVRLPMTRRDVGNYLRLATETVCRALTRFERKGWIGSTTKAVSLRNRAALSAVAAPLGTLRAAA